MKDVVFKYEKIGHIIMLNEKDWKRIIKFLVENGVNVTEEVKGEVINNDNTKRRK